MSIEAQDRMSSIASSAAGGVTFVDTFPLGPFMEEEGDLPVERVLNEDGNRAKVKVNRVMDLSAFDMAWRSFLTFCSAGLTGPRSRAWSPGGRRLPLVATAEG